MNNDPVFDRIAPTQRPHERVVMYQQWRDLLFLHWPIPAEILQPLLPPGLTLDTYEGVAYVGLVPFTMQGVRPVWSPRIPGISDFPECNVRTYVHRGGASPGVWFFSLDAANPVAVAIARALWKLPYFLAHMSVGHRPDDKIDYRTERIFPGPIPASTCTRYAVTGTPTPATPGTLEFFLVERYILYAYTRGRLWRGRVHHTPYPLQSATVDTLEDSSVATAGLCLPRSEKITHPPLIHYAAGVDVEVFPLRPLS